MTTRRFPDGFEWGTATAAHQVEGGNWNSDWWEFEHRPGSIVAEPSGDACDQWHRYPDDLRLLADLGFSTYRFSVEWARIEPEEGEFSTAALDHYARVCDTARDLGIQPVVTFHHFTTPRWAAVDGGWADSGIVDRFARYCERTARHLGADRIARACTINEPNIVASMGHMMGVFPPGHTDDAEWDAARANFCAAHRAGVDAIKSQADVPVGMTLSMAEYAAVDGGEEYAAAHQARMEDQFLDACRGDDFFGVQTYSRLRLGPQGMVGPEEGVELLPMGYEYWPWALEATLRHAWNRLDGQVPLLVTENGIGTGDDEQRRAYVQKALEGVLSAIDDGIDVRGYTYWSLLDNFEWIFGYRIHFGLVACDRTTFERTPKPTADWLGDIARTNAIDVA